MLNFIAAKLNWFTVLQSSTITNKAYRPNAHLLDIVIHYGKYYIILHYYYNHLNKL